MIRAALGFDTSCYTTSVALADADSPVTGRPYIQRRRPLEVPMGARGVRQSLAVFQHIGNLPELAEQLLAEQDASGARIVCVAASARPRPIEGSYMPVFTVGEGYGRAIAAALRVPFIPTSHQQGHVRAAMEGLKGYDAPFMAAHLSGGTTELLRVSGPLNVEILGETGDLNAGQLVDRVGVALGLPFPCGPGLEALAISGRAASRIPSSVKGLAISFSGAEACAKRLIASGDLSREDIAAEVYSCLARALGKWIGAAAAATGLNRALMAGGVASSLLLRRLVEGYISKMGIRIALDWALPELSGDNAVGVALIGAEALNRG